MNIQSLEFELTDSIRHELKHLEDTLNKYIDNTEDIIVVLSKENPTLFHVEISTNLLGHNVRSHHNSHDFHKALHLSRDKFIRNLSELKEKHRDLKRKN